MKIPARLGRGVTDTSVRVNTDFRTVQNTNKALEGHVPAGDGGGGFLQGRESLKLIAGEALVSFLGLIVRVLNRIGPRSRRKV